MFAEGSRILVSHTNDDDFMKVLNAVFFATHLEMVPGK